MKKKNISVVKAVFIVSLIASASVARISPIDSEKNLHDKKSTVRELVVDCLERGKSLSCHRLGIYYIEKREKYTKGLKYLRSSCQLGRGYSCALIGRYYEEGEIVDKNLELASQWYEIGCLRDSNEGCKNLLHVPKEKHESGLSSFFSNLFR